VDGRLCENQTVSLQKRPCACVTFLFSPHTPRNVPGEAVAAAAEAALVFAPAARARQIVAPADAHEDDEGEDEDDDAIGVAQVNGGMAHGAVERHVVAVARGGVSGCNGVVVVLLALSHDNDPEAGGRPPQEQEPAQDEAVARHLHAGREGRQRKAVAESGADACMCARARVCVSWIVEWKDVQLGQLSALRGYTCAPFPPLVLTRGPALPTALAEASPPLAHLDDVVGRRRLLLRAGDPVHRLRLRGRGDDGGVVDRSCRGDLGVIIRHLVVVGRRTCAIWNGKKVGLMDVPPQYECRKAAALLLAGSFPVLGRRDDRHFLWVVLGPLESVKRIQEAPQNKIKERLVVFFWCRHTLFSRKKTPTSRR
jgi:hypothetical protein